MQLSLAAKGGLGTAVPLLSIEVDDLDEALRRAQAAGAPIVCSPALWSLGSKGMGYNPLTKVYALNNDTAVNYMIACKPA